jgi:hypothetical protein
MPRHARAKLTFEQARDIYLRKLQYLTAHKPSRTYANCFTPEENALRGKSTLVSYRYNVSPKTIRDIWCRKTWLLATNDLVHDGNDPAMNGARGNEDDLAVEPWPNSTHELAHNDNDPFRDDAPAIEDELAVGLAVLATGFEDAGSSRMQVVESSVPFQNSVNATNLAADSTE